MRLERLFYLARRDCKGNHISAIDELKVLHREA
jgi:hypothetical protein